MSAALRSAFLGNLRVGRYSSQHGRHFFRAVPASRMPRQQARPSQAYGEIPMGFGSSTKPQAFSVESSGSSMDDIGQTGKVTVVGCGAVGMACASSIVSMNLCKYALWPCPPCGLPPPSPV